MSDNRCHISPVKTLSVKPAFSEFSSERSPSQHGVMSANRVELGILSFKSEAPVNGLGSNKSIFSYVFNLLWLFCGISASQELKGYRCSLLNTDQVCFPWRFSLFFPFLSGLKAEGVSYFDLIQKLQTWALRFGVCSICFGQFGEGTGVLLFDF